MHALVATQGITMTKETMRMAELFNKPREPRGPRGPRGLSATDTAMAGSVETSVDPSEEGEEEATSVACTVDESLVDALLDKLRVATRKRLRGIPSTPSNGNQTSPSPSPSPPSSCLRNARVAVLFSGGLDSTVVAALAHAEMGPAFSGALWRRPHVHRHCCLPNQTIPPNHLNQLNCLNCAN